MSKGTAVGAFDNPGAQRFYNEKMDEYRAQSAFLKGKNYKYFSSKEKEDAAWWGSYQIYTAIALAILLVMAVCIAAAVIATKFVL
jgi:hypothetical protein